MPFHPPQCHQTTVKITVLLCLGHPKASSCFVKGEIQQKENKLWGSPDPSCAPSCLLFAERWCYFSYVVILDVLLQCSCGHRSSSHYLWADHGSPMCQEQASWLLLATHIQGMKRASRLAARVHMCVCVHVHVCVWLVRGEEGPQH